jgi:probable DNA metabolism protein
MPPVVDFLRYDGTFPGLIRELGPWLRRGVVPEFIERSDTRQPSLFGCEHESAVVTPREPVRWIPTPEDLAAVGLPVISMPIWRRVWTAFLSEDVGIERRVGEYLLLAVERPTEIEDLLTDHRVQCILHGESRVRREAHALKGLVRFRRIDDRLYLATVSPKTGVLPMIAPFFARRFADQDWIIHDHMRRWAALYESGRLSMIPEWTRDSSVRPAEPSGPAKPVEPSEASEQAVQELWRCFFREVAVRERINLEAQRRHMPRRYWNDLIEEPGR